MKPTTKTPTYRQVIAAIKKEFNCTTDEARTINHQRNMGKVSEFCDKLKKNPKLKPALEAHFGRKFNF